MHTNPASAIAQKRRLNLPDDFGPVLGILVSWALLLVSEVLGPALCFDFGGVDDRFIALKRYNSEI
jgi:hypothetical protein